MRLVDLVYEHESKEKETDLTGKLMFHENFGLVRVIKRYETTGYWAPVTYIVEPLSEVDPLDACDSGQVFGTYWDTESDASTS